MIEHIVDLFKSRITEFTTWFLTAVPCLYTLGHGLFSITGMFQGYIIAAMPIIMCILYGTTSPESMKFLFTTPIGIIICLCVLALDILGLFVIIKIVKIKTD